MKRQNRKNKRPINLTARDRAFLGRLGDFGLLSTEQVKYLYFPSLHRTRKRLLQLFRHGLVRRIERPTRLGEGSKTYLYRLSPRGARLISASTPRSYSGKGSHTLSPLYAEHQLAINRFRICLELALRNCAELTLESWRADREVKLEVPGDSSREVCPPTLVPDGTFCLRAEGRSYTYLLEIDRATSPLSRLRAKILGYLRLFASSGRVGPIQGGRFRVLIVSSGTTRVGHLVGLIQALPATIRRPDIFRLASEHILDCDRPTLLLGTLWQAVSADRTVLHGQPAFPSLRSSRQHQVNHQCAVQNPILDTGGHGPGG